MVFHSQSCLRQACPPARTESLISVDSNGPVAFASESPEDFLFGTTGIVPRTLVIAAHPDDETIGAGILMERLRGVQIVHVTDGSPMNMWDAVAAGFGTRDAYAEARRQETLEALALAGVPESSISNLHFTDQQTSLHLQELIARIVEILEQANPDVLLTHAYEGGHPDHDSVAFACHMARTICSRRGAEVCQLLEFCGYHAADHAICVYEFLPSQGCREFRLPLTAEERDRKIQMLRTFRTQARTLTPFLSPQWEIFRSAPRYDFSRPPHQGRLFYEHFNWGLDGETWRKLAAQTQARVGI